MPYSNCCGAYTTETDLGLCPECLEHCEFEDDEEEKGEPMCRACNGTGEGQYNDSICKVCKGQG